MTSIKPRKPAGKESKQTTRKKTTKTTKAASRSTTRKREIGQDERLQMIREAAYFKAVQREFSNGDPTGDWFEAEAEIDQLIGA